MTLIGRFMAWKMATSFVLTAETWLGPEVTRSGDDALLAVGISRHERLAVIQRIRRGDTVGFSEPMWLAPQHVGDQCFAMLPKGETEISAEEEVELAHFRKDRRAARRAVGLPCVSCTMTGQDLIDEFEAAGDEVVRGNYK